MIDIGIFMIKFKTIKYFFGDDFMDIFGFGENENHAENFRKIASFW